MAAALACTAQTGLLARTLTAAAPASAIVLNAARRHIHSTRTRFAGADSGNVFTATDSDFDVKVMQSKVPVIVDYYADWCGPCRMLAPVLTKAVEAQNGAVKLAKVNVDDNPMLSMRANVSSIPLVIAYANGKEIDRFLGARDPNFLAGFVAKAAAAAGAKQ